MKSFRVLPYSLILLMVLTLSACNGIGTAEIDGMGAVTSDDDAPASFTFSGISSADQKTDSTVRLNWIAHGDAVAYDIFDVTSGSLVWIKTVLGQASSSHTLTGLTPNQLYKFRVRAKNTAGVNDGNNNDVAVVMNAAPDMPSGLSIVSPLSSPSLDATPVIKVSGVKSGDTIRLYSDNTCTTEIASETASGTTIDIATSSLGIGTYTIFANASNSISTSSACSTANVTYQRLACPPNFIPVSSNVSVGTTNDFCVMKFEAKSVAGVATSQATSAPWASVTQTSAKSACTALGVGYDLISNAEWMTLAHDVEATASNWDGGVVGVGALFRGHTDSAPLGALAASNVLDPYDGTGNTPVQGMGAGREQKRTFTLSNGEVIWDLSGNVWEWTDWALGGPLTPGPDSCSNVWTELPDINCADLAAIDYMPGNPAGVASGSYDATYGLGRFHGGVGGAALRGGAWPYGDQAGVFMLLLNYASDFTSTSVGFRCVYRQ